MAVTTQTAFDRTIEAVSHPRRRRVLVRLHENGEPITIGGYAGNGDDDTGDDLIPSLVHAHLPKLDQMDYIDWDPRSGEVSRGDRWDEIEPLLRVMYENRDDLPDGYF